MGKPGEPVLCRIGYFWLTDFEEHIALMLAETPSLLFCSSQNKFEFGLQIPMISWVGASFIMSFFIFKSIAKTELPRFFSMVICYVGVSVFV